MNETIASRIEEMRTAAGQRYNERYNNELYRQATEGKSVAYGNLLIDQALCLCGHPNYTPATRNFSDAALNFLSLFC